MVEVNPIIITVQTITLIIAITLSINLKRKGNENNPIPTILANYYGAHALSLFFGVFYIITSPGLINDIAFFLYWISFDLTFLFGMIFAVSLKKSYSYVKSKWIIKIGIIIFLIFHISMIILFISTANHILYLVILFIEMCYGIIIEYLLFSIIRGIKTVDKRKSYYLLIGFLLSQIIASIILTFVDSMYNEVLTNENQTIFIVYAFTLILGFLLNFRAFTMKEKK